MAGKRHASSVDQAEIERFSRHAADWWNPHGPMAALHKFNPIRLGYIRDQSAAHFTRDPKKLIPPLHGALLKNEQDVHLFERLAFLNRRERG